MTHKKLFIATAVILIIFGLIWFFIPNIGLNVYGHELQVNDLACIITRYWGSAFIALAVILWLAREGQSDSIAVRAIIIGGLGMMNAMAMSVMERTREIGVLRALGWPKRRILNQVVQEGLLLCLLASVLGAILGVAMMELFVLEPTFGLDRSVLAVIDSAYNEEEVEDEVRTVLKFPKAVAPIKAAVFPLLKNKPELVAKAKAGKVLVAYDGSIPAMRARPYVPSVTMPFRLPLIEGAKVLVAL